MHPKIISTKDAVAKNRFRDIVQTTGAAVGAAGSVFVLSLPLALHFGARGGSTGQVLPQQPQLTAMLGRMMNDSVIVGNNTSLFQTHSSGALGLAWTLGLSALTVFYGLPLARDAVQKSLLQRFTLDELQVKFPEFKNTSQELFALQTGLKDKALLEPVFTLLKQQEIITPDNSDAVYTVNAQNCTEELYTALFDLGLTIGQTDAVIAYLRNTTEQNAGLFFKRPLTNSPKFIARFAKFTLNEQRALARQVFRAHLPEEQEIKLLNFWHDARKRTIPVEAQIALCIILLLSISTYNFISGHYIPCCPIHESLIELFKGGPWKNYVGAMPGLAEAALLAILMGYFSNLIENTAENKAKNNLLRATSSSLLEKNYMVIQGAQQITVPLENITPQSVLVLKSGQQLPVDAVAIKPMTISEAFRTGESAKIKIEAGQKIHAGSIVLDDLAQVCAVSTYAGSSLAQMAKRIQQALGSKLPTENMVDTVTSYWTAFIGSVSATYFLHTALTKNVQSIKDALIIMVAATPCAIKLAIPIAKYAMLSGLSAAKIILRDLQALNSASKIQTVVFDKTNTLTDMSRLSINELHYSSPNAAKQREALAILYAMELNSNHPIAEEIRKYASQTLGSSPPGREVQDFAVLGGSKAIRGSYLQNGRKQEVVIGSTKYLRDTGLLTGAEFAQVPDNAVVMSIDGELQLYLNYTEKLREDAVETIITLQKMGKKIVTASGDTPQKVDSIAEQINSGLQARGARPLDGVYAGLQPADKINIIRSLQKDANGKKQYVTMIGDGDNDSEAIAAADLGISWNASGLARNGAHVIVTEGDSLAKVVDIFKISRHYSANVLGSAAIAILGNAAIIAGIRTDFIGSKLLYPLGSLLGGEQLGIQLRTGDLLFSMIAHESLSFFAGLNALQLGRKKKTKPPNKDKSQIPQI
ncbi:MAG: HAD-IC family P-type ATPase [Candidatus Margulisbacteria bacterium]|jgi:cation transport ATPase|nr:HAD-IC family P-type ATPase [Candidatus Margulisiibacteriota bacterium]